MLADSGVLDGDGDLDELAVPTSLQAMIGSRLDGAARPGQARRPARLGRRACVFWSGASPSCTARRREVDPSLDALEQRDFVRAQRRLDDRRRARVGRSSTR